ncbi:MAG TPA: imidazolonepropionase [Cytophagales bacterium]|nr:imidazolonepropionase [Cytophagales bacterium]HCR53613.1 imidazolonepropionase [Cytophagales bacterium]
MAWDILITNIKGLVQVRDSTPNVLSGGAMAELPILENAFLAIQNGVIVDYGSMQSLSSTTSNEVVDASNRFVLPSFVDSHTHLVFAASREEEFVMKIKGASYAEIAARGGGILNSAQKLQGISEDELFERSLKRAIEIIKTGTGAVEIKSGYGLTVNDELKMLRVARRLGEQTPLKVKTTFLGAHAVPKSHTKSDYIQLIMQEMIPAVAEEKLADYIDVFCEEGFFNPDETEMIAEEGKKFGMRPRIHANQLHRSGGVQVGVKVNAISVDHLENIGREEIEILQNSQTIPTALPGAAFFLNLPFPPARDIINANLPLAIASDFNPGSAPSGNMSLMIALACIKMRLTPEEAFNATTVNTAAAMEILNTHGSITKGKVANISITKPMSSLAYLPYSFGTQLIDQVILNGKFVLRAE